MQIEIPLTFEDLHMSNWSDTFSVVWAWQPSWWCHTHFYFRFLLHCSRSITLGIQNEIFLFQNSINKVVKTAKTSDCWPVVKFGKHINVYMIYFLVNIIFQVYLTSKSIFTHKEEWNCLLWNQSLLKYFLWKHMFLKIIFCDSLFDIFIWYF